MSLVPRYCPRCGGSAHGGIVCPPRSDLGFDADMFAAAASDIARRDARIAELKRELAERDAQLAALRYAEEDVRAEVRRFAQAMERKLSLNDHKGHWQNCTLGYLFKRLRQELRELEGACHAETMPPDAVLDEAADVANFAMMIADRARQLRGG